MPTTLGQKGSSFSENRKSSVSYLSVLLRWSIFYFLRYGSDLHQQVANGEGELHVLNTLARSPRADWCTGIGAFGASRGVPRQMSRTPRSCPAYGVLGALA